LGLGRTRGRGQQPNRAIDDALAGEPLKLLHHVRTAAVALGWVPVFFLACPMCEQLAKVSTVTLSDASGKIGRLRQAGASQPLRSGAAQGTRGVLEAAVQVQHFFRIVLGQLSGGAQRGDLHGQRLLIGWQLAHEVFGVWL
jgi:hypothetical protein